MKQTVVKKILIFVGVLVVMIPATWFAWGQIKLVLINSYDSCVKDGYLVKKTIPAQCTTSDKRLFVEKITDKKIDLEGLLECLPHKNKSGPQTMECAIGFKDDFGSHYGLSDATNKFLQENPVGSRVEVVGLLSTTTDSKYSILGTIKITTLTKK